MIKIILIIIIYHILREVDGVPEGNSETKIIVDYGGDYSESDESIDVDQNDVRDRRNNPGKPGEVSFLGSKHILNYAVPQDWGVDSLPRQ